MADRVDLFRTESQLVAAIGRAKVRIAIAVGYNGGEGIALKQGIMRANLRVDERCLARLRGEKVTYPDGEEPRADLKGEALTRWRAEIIGRRR